MGSGSTPPSSSSRMAPPRSPIALRNAHAALSRGGYRVLVSDGTSLVFVRYHADEEIVVAIHYQAAGTTVALDTLVGSATYASLFAYGAAPAAVAADAAGHAVLAMPAGSVQVFRLARTAPPFGVAVYVRGSMNGWADP